VELDEAGATTWPPASMERHIGRYGMRHICNTIAGYCDVAPKSGLAGSIHDVGISDDQ